MGTRADFYIGRGENAEWLGSIAWDGYPDPPGIGKSSPDVLGADDEDLFRVAVAAMLVKRRDGTTPDKGWPWPWDDSGTTDYAYAFDDGRVWSSQFGSGWIDAADAADGAEHPDNKDAVFPDMSGGDGVTLGERSGVIVFGV